MNDKFEDRYVQVLEDQNAFLCEEIDRLKEKCDKQAMILRRLTPENYPDILFIHADGGTKDINGMPERLYVVPAYGCDWSQVYERTDKVTGPEW
jgi:hypothetical protein